MKRILILCLILFPSLVNSQTPELKDTSSFIIGLNLGLNYSKFNNEDVNYNYASKALIGVSWKYQFTNDLFLKSSLNYSLKGSTLDNPFKKYEIHYLDLDIMPQYQFVKDFYLHGGVSLSGLILPLEVTTKDDSWSGTGRYRVDGFSSELNFLIGMEFKLFENVNLQLNYIIPQTSTNTNNFQITASINLNKRKRKISVSKVMSSISLEQINQLYSGVLIVRLHNSEKVIEAMNKVGNTKRAAELEEYNLAHNKAIVQAFRNHFSFCEIRFFYSSNSTSILNKEYKNIFLNDSLQIDSAINIDSDRHVFIAEFGNLESDSLDNIYYVSYEHDVTSGVKKTNRYFSEDDFNFYGLIIKDHNFIQLKSPFPFYVRSTRATFSKDIRHIFFIKEKFNSQIEKSVIESVISLNNNLLGFYSLNSPQFKE